MRRLGLVLIFSIIRAISRAVELMKHDLADRIAGFDDHRFIVKIDEFQRQVPMKPGIHQRIERRHKKAGIR